MVAGYAAKQLVEGGLKPGELTIVSADSSVPYERPPLSKSFLAGKDTEASVLINAGDFYQKHEIGIRTEPRPQLVARCRHPVNRDSTVADFDDANARVARLRHQANTVLQGESLRITIRREACDSSRAPRSRN